MKEAAVERIWKMYKFTLCLNKKDTLQIKKLQNMPLILLEKTALL